ncbi:hypothetical protein [Acinetobacter haemolyticus]|uniref:hypothetical protein n=1 Tax=Acinetobacter haemolyticus TaxID=29430 RepID=UPI00196AC4FD|nr:hypothetical protein [Acinetobacter haemolyticus]
MVENPVSELLFGLAELKNNSVYQERFLLPMVFDVEKVTWEQAYTHFQDSGHRILGEVKF